MAGTAVLHRDFACLVVVSHMTEGDTSRLRLVAGVTGVIDGPDGADLHMIVAAADRRSAQRLCVELVTTRLPQSVVTVPEVVDYNHALLTFLEQHGEHPDDVATFDDAEAVSHILDRA